MAVNKKRISASTTDPQKDRMILISKITPQILSKEGKGHKWPPCTCKNCNRRMWGHGFVARYFSCICQQIFLKRYRCPGCGSVLTTRPEGFWAFIRSSIVQIYRSLHVKLATGQWPPETPRQRGGHWLRRFVANSKMSCEVNLLTFLDRCFEKGLHFFA
jgi:hypothetical protein